MSMRNRRSAPTLPPQPETLTSKDIAGALRRHLGKGWLIWRELALATGMRNSGFVDLFALHEWPSGNHERRAYEIKVSRGDFLREIKAPLKRKIAMCWSNRYYFVTPPGLVKPEEVPADCGLIEVVLDWRVSGFRRTAELELVAHVAVGAPWRDTPPPSWELLASMARSYRQPADGGGSDGEE